MDSNDFVSTFTDCLQSVPKRVLAGWEKNPEVFKMIIEDCLQASIPIEFLIKRVPLSEHELAKRLSEGTPIFQNDAKNVKKWNSGRSIRAVELRPRQIGLCHNEVSYGELVTRAASLGYKTCPHSAFLFLKPSFKEKSDVFFASEPVKVGVEQRLFMLKYGETDGSGGWGSSGYPYWTRDSRNASWSFVPDSRWVFAV